MANLIYKNEKIKWDNSTGTATEITNWVTSESLSGSQDTIEDSAMGDEEKSYLAGMAGATLSLSGIVNTTTNGLFATYLGNRTTALRTYQRAASMTNSTTGLILRGEFMVTGLEYSGSSNSLQTFSLSAICDGIMTKTSIFAA
jgi:hypothetical protein